MRGWLGLYGLSLSMGLRQLLRGRHLRAAIIRVVIPLDPGRYVELPWALRRLSLDGGPRVLDVGSPKLLAVALARRGVRMTVVDELEPEIAAWRSLARGVPGLELVVGDGHSLPYEDASFDHAMSISVLEHVPDGGDREVLRELARCVRPGGCIVLTMPYAGEAWDEYRQQAMYVDHGADERGHFFQRWYDEATLEALLASVPEVRLAERSLARVAPNWQRAYDRAFPWLVLLGPLYGVLGVERVGPGGDVLRLVLERI